MADGERAVRPATASWELVGLAWVAGGVPLCRGIWTTLKKGIVLVR
jgi:hypothetical protein